MRLSSQIFAYGSWKLFKSCETEALSSPLLSFLGNIPFKEYLPVRYFELLITICQIRRPFLSLLVFNLSCINFHGKSFLLYPNHSLYLRGRPSQFLAFFLPNHSSKQVSCAIILILLLFQYRRPPCFLHCAPYFCILVQG